MSKPPVFCWCDDPDPCCQWCFRCVACKRLYYPFALERVYEQGTRHPGDYAWGGGGYVDEPATFPCLRS